MSGSGSMSGEGSDLIDDDDEDGSRASSGGMSDDGEEGHGSYLGDSGVSDNEF
jgi:hypothetical protein